MVGNETQNIRGFLRVLIIDIEKMPFKDHVLKICHDFLDNEAPRSFVTLNVGYFKIL